MFPKEAEITYFPETSPTNLPSSKIKPDAVLLLSKDFPVNEYLKGKLSFIFCPFL